MRFANDKIISAMYDLHKIREDFPILEQEVYKRPLVYFDNAATTQKPRVVIDAISNAYCTINANVHRGVHHLSQLSTEGHEGGREKVRQFLNAKSTKEIIFTRGTTEALNLVVSSFCEEFMQEGDEVVVHGPRIQHLQVKHVSRAKEQ